MSYIPYGKSNSLHNEYQIQTRDHDTGIWKDYPLIVKNEKQRSPESLKQEQDEKKRLKIFNIVFSLVLGITVPLFHILLWGGAITQCWDPILCLYLFGFAFIVMLFMGIMFGARDIDRSLHLLTKRSDEELRTEVRQLANEIYEKGVETRITQFITGPWIREFGRAVELSSLHDRRTNNGIVWQNGSWQD